MSEADPHAESRVRLLGAGLGQADMRWIDGLNWSDAAVPPIRDEAQFADYRRREKILNAAVAAVSFAERAASPEGRLAAAIGARVADWRERNDNED